MTGRNKRSETVVGSTTPGTILTTTAPETAAVVSTTPVMTQATAPEVVEVAAPEVAAVVEPVLPTDAKIPTVAVERVETAPLVEPTAIVPGLVYEETTTAADAHTPKIVVTEGGDARFVEVLCDANLGTKRLKRGDITDDAEYVALLNTARGRTLVREVK